MHDACMCSATGVPAVGIFPLTCTSMRISRIDVNDATLTELFGSSQYSVEVSTTDGLNDSLELLNSLLPTARCTGSLDNNNNNGNVHVLTMHILSALHKL